MGANVLLQYAWMKGLDLDNPITDELLIEARGLYFKMPSRTKARVFISSVNINFVDAAGCYGICCPFLIAVYYTDN